MKHLHTPLTQKDISSLKAGERVLLSGEVYTARDQAHKRLCECLKKKKKLPIDLRRSILFYCGPTPEKKDAVIGSCGPTTASRMDSFTPPLMKKGLRAMIGKGNRSNGVREAIKKMNGIYFITYGGCGAYLNQCVTKRTCIAFADLGPEAIYKLTVKDFPLIVGIDCQGRSLQ